MLKRLLILVIILLLLLGLFGNRVLRAAIEDDVYFSVNKGDGLLNIAYNLTKEGITDRPLLFTLYAIFSGNRNNLQAGEYRLSHKSIPELVNTLSSGRVHFRELRVIEGWNLIEIANYLEKKNFASAEDFFQVTGITGPQSKFIEKEFSPKNFDFSVLKSKPDNFPLEGFLFPDTYYVRGDESVEDLVKMMISNLDEKITDEMIEDIEANNRTVFDIITMASLIEREVRNEEDKKMISDILWRRKGAGIPLQVDATVNYVLGRNTLSVSIIDTQVESPYNTYYVNGLPAGPIASPGFESIKAAIYPKANNYWYYLSDPATGKTVFSKNHAEHVSAKNRYLR